MLKYHKIFLVGTRKKYTSINFPGGRKNWKMAIFGLHNIKVSSIFMSLQLTYWIHNFKFKIIAMTMWNFIEIYWLEALQNWAWKSIFSRFFWFRRDFWDPWVLYLRTGWSHKNFIKKQSCRVSKSKIIMCLWSVALKARKAAKWPRTFYMVWTVVVVVVVFTESISINNSRINIDM